MHYHRTMTTLDHDEAKHRAAQLFRCSPDDVTVEALGGDVSNRVFGIRAFEHFLVMKQPYSNLQVEADWPASTERIHNEAEAMRRWRSWEDGPVRVPRVINEDTKNHIVIFEGVDGPTYKEALLDGTVDKTNADKLGTFLGRMHRRSQQELDTLTAFTDQPLTQLRVDPYHRTVASKNPDLKPEIDQAIRELCDNNRALVHGDYSPKNVITADNGLYVIDFEVAHTGEPLFDLAFFLNHLCIKFLYCRQYGARLYRDSIERAFRAYDNSVPWPVDRTFYRQLGVLIIARVDGKSPVEYVDPKGAVAGAMRTMGRALLDAQIESVAELTDRLQEASHELD